MTSFWEALAFSKRQKKGITVFLVLLTFLMLLKWIIMPHSIDLFYGDDLPHLSPDIFVRIDSFEKNTSPSLLTNYIRFNSKHKVNTLESHILEINTADSMEWISINGIGPVLSARIIRFRESLGGFHSVDQLQHVYGLSEECFNRMKPLLWLDSTLIPNPSHPNANFSPNTYLHFENGNKNNHSRLNGVKKYNSNFSIEINTADSIEWKQLPGIGSVLSKRIVKYRAAKRGFKQITEVGQVYGLDQEVFKHISMHLWIDSTLNLDSLFYKNPLSTTTLLNDTINNTGHNKIISTMDTSVHFDDKWMHEEIDVLELNQADSVSLAKLPGIGPTLAHRIISFRKIIGFYASLDLLQHVYGLSEKNFLLMKSYLYVDTEIDYEKVDLNTVSLKKLSYYPCMKDGLAEKLMNLRKQLGYFSYWEEVAQLKEIGPQCLELLQLYFEI